MTMQVTLGFGIRVGGHDIGITFPTIRDAEDGADHLFGGGYKLVEVFRRTGDQAQLRPPTEISPTPDLFRQLKHVHT